MSKVTFLLPTILLVVTFSTKSFSQEGEKLFKGNCAVCHTVGKGKLVGPDLKGVDTRYEQTWLLKWIKSSQTMVKSGDKKAVQIFNDNAGLVMPDQALNDDEIKAVLAFVKEKELQVASAVQNATADNNVASQKNRDQANGSLLSMLGFSGYIMIMLIGLLMIVIWVMSLSIKKISIDIKEKNKS